jgi:hypothetical protein
VNKKEINQQNSKLKEIKEWMMNHLKRKMKQKTKQIKRYKRFRKRIRKEMMKN